MAFKYILPLLIRHFYFLMKNNLNNNSIMISINRKNNQSLLLNVY